MRTAASILVLTAALAAPPALAQNREEATQLGEVVVTAARSVLPASALPLTVDVIDNRTLEQQVRISGSVVDAVSALTPSFSPTRQKLSGAGETLRGRSPLYAINGIPQSTPLRDGSRDGFTIDPFFVDRVEVIFGSNALQGIGATGGVVNQVTVGPPAEEGISGRTLLQLSGDNDLHGDGLGTKAAGLLSWRRGVFDATGGVAYETRGAFYDARGRRIGFDTVQGEIQDSESWSLFGRLGYAVSDTARLDLILSRFQLDGDGDYVSVTGNRAQNLPTSAVRGRPPGTPARGRTESAALTYTDDDLVGGALVTQVFYNRTRDTFGSDPTPIATFQDPRIAPVGTLFDQSENRSEKIGAKFSYERAAPGWEDLTATIGLDLLRDETEQVLIATSRSWVPLTEFTSVAPFVQGNLKLFGGKLRVALGARQENVRIKIDDFTTLYTSNAQFVSGGAPEFSNVLVNGGVIFEPMPGVRAYVSYAEGYTVPDVGRITRAINTPGVDIDDYLDIEPIISNNREIGLELKRGPLDASATYFWSSSDKGQVLVLTQPAICLPPTPPAQRPPPEQCLGVFNPARQKVEIEGLELNATLRTAVPGLTVSAGYAHLIGRTDSNGDGGVDIDLDGANISPDRVLVAANYNQGPWAARLQFQGFLARDFSGAPPANNFKGYNLVDGSVRYQTESLGGVTLAVQNLFDKFYIDYNSDTQRPTDNLRFFAGRGRTITLAWDYRF